MYALSAFHLRITVEAVCVHGSKSLLSILNPL